MPGDEPGAVWRGSRTLDDFAARFYTSNYGRFLSADDSKYIHPADPQTLNLYTYVANNPLNSVDPTGHEVDPLLANAPANRYKPMEHGESLDDSPGEDGGPESDGTNSGGTASGSNTNTYIYLVTNPDGTQDLVGIQAKNGNDAYNAAISGAWMSSEQLCSPGADSPQAQLKAQLGGNTLSAAGLNFLTSEEGFRDKIYNDQAGKPTIGYGHKILDGEDFSKGITRDAAAALLAKDVGEAVGAVNGSLKVPISQNQFDALVSFAYNAGRGAVSGDKQMMTAVNSGKVTQGNFTTYSNYHDSQNIAHFSQGMFDRRVREYNFFSGGR